MFTFLHNNIPYRATTVVLDSATVALSEDSSGRLILSIIGDGTGTVNPAAPITVNTLTRWASSTTITDSGVSDDGTTVQVASGRLFSVVSNATVGGVLGVNGATGSANYPLAVSTALTGARLFRFQGASHSLFGYTDGSGVGITNTDPYGTGAMLYFASGTTQVYAAGNLVLNVTGSQVQAVGVPFTAPSDLGYRLGGIPALVGDATYRLLRDPQDRNAIHLGGTADPANYYDNTNHFFRNRASGAGVSVWIGGGVGGETGIRLTNDDNTYLRVSNGRTSQSGAGIIIQNPSNNAILGYLYADGGGGVGNGQAGILPSDGNWGVRVNNAGVYLHRPTLLEGSNALRFNTLSGPALSFNSSGASARINVFGGTGDSGFRFLNADATVGFGWVLGYADINGLRLFPQNGSRSLAIRNDDIVLYEGGRLLVQPTVGSAVGDAQVIASTMALGSGAAVLEARADRTRWAYVRLGDNNFGNFWDVGYNESVQGVGVLGFRWQGSNPSLTLSNDGALRTFGAVNGVVVTNRNGDGSSSTFYKDGTLTYLWDSAYGNVLQYSTSGAVQVNSVFTALGRVEAQGGYRTYDLRQVAPSQLGAGAVHFHFGSFANNNTSPWADAITFRSWGDGSGGADNLLVFSKGSIAARLYQQTFGSSTAFSSWRDFVMTDGNSANVTIGGVVAANGLGSDNTFPGGITGRGGRRVPEVEFGTAAPSVARPIGTIYIQTV